MWRAICVSCSLLALSQPTLAALDEQGTKEVNSLLDFVERSGCTFIRNDSEHASADARAHLQKKLDYLLDKDLIDSPEQFIKRGATVIKADEAESLPGWGQGRLDWFLEQIVTRDAFQQKNSSNANAAAELNRLKAELLAEHAKLYADDQHCPLCGADWQAHDNMLQKMRRHVTKDETYKLIEQFREEVPGIHLRTTLMVGHPGETEADFEELKEFVRKVRFDRMGAFAYSEEEGTYAAAEYEDSIPQEVKQARLDELMSIQQGISGELSAEKVGRQMKVIIDRLEGEYYIGRTEFDSPEVDPEVLIERGDRALHIGNFYHVEIVNSDDFDLFGRII